MVNPRGRIPIVRRDLCKGCGLCAAACPTKAIDISSGRIRVSWERCWGCMSCAASCPRRAIQGVSLEETARMMGGIEREIRVLSAQVARLGGTERAGEPT